MNTRHIQSFLMVSAAFFAMSGPVRAHGASALAAAGVQMRQLAPAAQDIAVAAQPTTVDSPYAPAR
ncbi:hypothetical protein [Burkholderia guangdongensis]|uniref:hypothetical protein n=1 Tax=Burkholderia guangdongensis TaxID=1792500 RepID=UPI0015CCD252|nr:hypothetical protein [Burkholderia guangdongensis]